MRISKARETSNDGDFNAKNPYVYATACLVDVRLAYGIAY